MVMAAPFMALQRLASALEWAKLNIMVTLELDHIAVACTDLARDAPVLSKTLGTPLDIEGAHPDMGTHNRLTGMGPHYFELIAINPAAQGPGRPRWFNIDHFTGPPRLTNWILRTTDLEAALTTLPDGFGTPISLQRGDLKWRMAVPDNGILPWGGWAPALIEWQGDAHPTQTLPDSGLRLSRLTLHHPDAEQIAATLGPLMPTDTAQFMPADTPKLVAILNGPNGEIRLQ